MKLKWTFLVNGIFHTKEEANAELNVTQVKTSDLYITSRVWHHCIRAPHTMLYSKDTQYIREMWRWLMWVLWLLKGWKAQWGWNCSLEGCVQVSGELVPAWIPHSQLLRVLLKAHSQRFPGGAVVRTQCFHWGAWVQSLAGELRFCKLCDTAK